LPQGIPLASAARLAMLLATKKIQTGKYSVTATVGIGPNDAGGFALAVKLSVRLPELEKSKAQHLVEIAHQVCPNSNATRGNIPVELEVVEHA
jgi:Ohr subfamily peroxiredoxin